MSLFNKLFGGGPANLSQWTDLGEVIDSFEIPYLHPDHHNYPAWPGDRFLKLLKTKWNTHIVFSQGLSSPRNQLSYEIYLETSEDVEDFSSSWQANLVYEIGKLVPKVADLNQRLSNHKYLSVQIDMDGAPDEWSIQDANGNIGLFLGLDNQQFTNFKPSFIPLNIKLMRPQEIQYAIKNGSEGRMLLASLYSKQGGQTLSFMDRSSAL